RNGKNIRAWWNVRHVSLRCSCAQACGGSTPLARTKSCGGDATGRHPRLRTGVLEVRILSAVPYAGDAIGRHPRLRIGVLRVRVPSCVPILTFQVNAIYWLHARTLGLFEGRSRPEVRR